MGMNATALLVKDCWNKKYVANILLKYSKLIDLERLYLFFQLFNQQPDALNSVTPNAFAHSKAFSTIHRCFLTSFSNKPAVYCLIYLFVVPTTFFREEFIPFFFFNEAVNLCLFLANVETVFYGTPYLIATTLLVKPFSRSFKNLHFSAKGLFVSLCFIGANFLKITSDEKLKTFVVYFPTEINPSNFRLLNFDRNIKTKIRENEKKLFKGPTILINLVRQSRYRDLKYREFFAQGSV